MVESYINAPRERRNAPAGPGNDGYTAPAAWIRPASVRWILQPSSADYFDTMTTDIHRAASSHILAVEQHGVSPERLASLSQEHTSAIHRV